MKYTRLKRAFIAASIPLLVIGLGPEAATAQHQICMKVSGALFSEQGVDGWHCKRRADASAPPNQQRSAPVVLNVNYFDHVPFQNEVSQEPPYENGNHCFQDRRFPANPDGVMTGAFHVHKKNNWVFAQATHWEGGWDIDGPPFGNEVLYMMQLVEGEIDLGFAPFPPVVGSTTQIWFPKWKIETEGKGRLKKRSCVGSDAFKELYGNEPWVKLRIKACEYQGTDPDTELIIPCP